MTLPGTLIRSKAYGGNRYDFFDWGVVVFADGTREVMRCRLANVVCGTVDASGIWLATSTNGVWRVPLSGSGDITGSERRTYTAETAVALPSSVCVWIDSIDYALVVSTDAGMAFISVGGAAYYFADTSGCGSCAIDASSIAYAPSAGGVHYLAHPSADWDSGDVTALTTGSSPAILSNTVQALAFADDLFIGTASGVSVYDGTSVTNYTSSALGTVVDIKAVHPAAGATRTSGRFAYATSNGSDGGRFGIYDITGASNVDTVSGDATGCWMDDNTQSAIYNDTLVEYLMISPLTPGYGARGVRRDWSIYAEIIDTIDGIETDSVTLEVNGSSVTPTVTAITDGYKVEYTPAGASGYQARITCVLSAVDGDGNAVIRTWSFTTEELPAAVVTNTAIPNITCYRDISLTADEADEVIGTVRVVYLDDFVGQLIVDDAQAQAVGKVLIDENTYHRRIRTIRTPLADGNGDDVKDLRQGDIVTLHCPAIGMTNKKCEVLAKQRAFNNKNRPGYTLIVAYYEAV